MFKLFCLLLQSIHSADKILFCLHGITQLGFSHLPLHPCGLVEGGDGDALCRNTNSKELGLSIGTLERGRMGLVKAPKILPCDHCVQRIAKMVDGRFATACNFCCNFQQLPPYFIAEAELERGRERGESPPRPSLVPSLSLCIL